MNNGWRNNNSDCPCKECDIHTITCHVVCGKYSEWKKKQEIRNAEERKARGSSDLMSDAKKKAIWRKMRYSKQGPRNTHKEG